MSVTADPAPALISTAPRHRVRAWDVLLTVLFVIGMIVVGVWGSFTGLLGLAFMDTCPPTGCDGSPIYLRWLGTAVLGLIAFVVSVVLLALRRRGWWVALIGLVGTFLLWSEFLVATIAYSFR